MLNYTDILGVSEVHTFYSLKLHKRVEILQVWERVFQSFKKLCPSEVAQVKIGHTIPLIIFYLVH